jgi:predicted kinase
MRTMILLSAIPGSGKSTWARAFAADHPNTFIVSSDEIRKSLYGSVTNFQHEPEVWKTYLDTINNYADTMHDVTVIADATNLQNKYRIFYHDATPHFDKHILVLFKIPYDVCLIQNKMRTTDRVVPVSAMEKLEKEYEEPTEDVLKLYDEVQVVTSYFNQISK